MRFDYLALFCFAAFTATAAVVPVEAAEATVEAREVPCGCTGDFIGNSYGCDSPFPNQNYCQLRGVDGDYPRCLSFNSGGLTSAKCCTACSERCPC